MTQAFGWIVYAMACAVFGAMACARNRGEGCEPENP